MSRTPGLGHLLIGQPEIGERMMRALSLKGALPQFIDGDVDPVALVEDLTRPEYLWLRRESSWSAGLSVGAVAGAFGVCVVGPKAGALGSRPAIAVIDRVIIQNISLVVTSYRFGLLSTAQAGSASPVGSGAPRDDRAAGPNAESIFAAGVGSNAVNPITFTQTPTIRLAVDATYQLDGPWILTGAAAPTAGNQILFGVMGGVINQAVQCTIHWRERAFLATEAT